MKNNSDKGWIKEKESLNIAISPLFIYASIFGIMIYSVFDYYAVKENFLLFFKLRLAVGLIGIILLMLLKRKIVTSLVALSVFLIVVYTFFAWGASVLTNVNQLFAWNLSIIVAGLLWPYFILIIDYKKAILFNLYFTAIYLVFYFINSSVSFPDLLIYGGVFFVFAAVASPLMSITKYRMHKRDFTNKLELKLLNKNLENLNHNLLEAVYVKNRFFSIIAHDLKDPFNSLIGFSNLLIESIQEKNYDEVEEHSRIIHDGLNQTYNLTKNLLEWSNTQTATHAYNPKKIVPAELITEVCANIKHVAEQKQIKISSTLNSELEILADKDMMETILRNLISNAIKFTKKGGLITISAETGPDETIFSVSDNGVGIHPDDLEKLFKVENLISKKGTNNEKGTGLGLLLCKELIEKHQGKIWVSSEAEKGSIFYFSIPNRQ